MRKLLKLPKIRSAQIDSMNLGPKASCSSVFLTQTNSRPNLLVILGNHLKSWSGLPLRL